MLRQMSIGARIIAIISLLIFCIILLITTMVFTANNVKNIGIADAQQVMLEGEKNKLFLGTHTIAAALGEALKGVADPAQQAEIIGRYINDIRFENDKSGYYFVYRGTVVFVHPVQPALAGKDLNNTSDANGVYYVRELNENAKRGGGFVSFIFGKPQPGGGVANAPKLAYVEMIPGTDLWISTGIYVDNIDVYKADMEARISSHVSTNIMITVGCMLAVGLFLLLPVCLRTVRSISGPLRDTTRAAEQIASGDLDVKLTAEGKDEITALQQSLMRMAENLRASFAAVQTKETEALAQAESARKAAEAAEAAMVKADGASRGMRQAAGLLEDAAHEMERTISNISDSTAAVKDGATTQEARVQEILRAMEQLSASVLDIAHSASAAATQSEEARTRVEDGAGLAKESGTAVETLGGTVAELTRNIHELGRQASGIGTIMDMINDVADQTNLLALNAAIEAARAGEAGRGFAVVADEVRKLAEKTMQATHEVRSAIVSIQGLSQANIAGMDGAVTGLNHVRELSGKTVSALGGVQASVREAALQVQSIAAAVEQQSTSSSAVTDLVVEVNSIAATNAEQVSQANAELHTLVSKSGQLLELVADLRTSKG